VVVAACSSSSATTVPASAPPTAAPTAAAPSAAPSAPTPAIPPPSNLITPGKLVDCVDIEYPPMEFFPDGSDVTDASQSAGFDVDAGRAIAKALGLEIEIRNAAFDAVIPDLGAGRCDIVMTALFISEKRLAVADAVPYMATGHVIMVPVGNPKAIKGPMDLCGKPVSIQSGGVVETKIKEASADCTAAGKPAIDVHGYPKVADEFQQIALGRVDAVWEVDLGVADWQNRNPGQYEVAYALPKTDVFGIYFQKNRPDMQAALEAALRALKADGTLAQIATKYSIDPVTLDSIK
jgi:ABC-type amino acid transport substrate-binding protein